MADQKKLFPNPFYLLLLVASTLFVLTALGYLVAPSLAPAAGAGARERGVSEALASWLDRRGPWLIAIEVTAMIVTGFLSMLTDRWFPERPDSTSTTAP